MRPAITDSCNKLGGILEHKNIFDRPHLQNLSETPRITYAYAQLHMHQGLKRKETPLPQITS